MAGGLVAGCASGDHKPRSAGTTPTTESRSVAPDERPVTVTSSQQLCDRVTTEAVSRIVGAPVAAHPNDQPTQFAEKLLECDFLFDTATPHGESSFRERVDMTIELHPTAQQTEAIAKEMRPKGSNESLPPET